MKTFSIFTMTAAAACMLACSGTQASYDVTGCNFSDEGATVYLMDRLNAMPIDSAVVTDGAFQMKGKADKNAFLAVNVGGSGWNSLFLNDGKPVKVNMADSTVTGSALNNKVTECDKRLAVSYNQFRGLVTAYLALPDDEQSATEAEFIRKYEDQVEKYSDEVLAIVEENKNSLVPVAFIEQIPDFFGVEKLLELCATDAPFTKHPFVQDLKSSAEKTLAQEQASENVKEAIIGKKFLDLEEADKDGNLHKLSEYVGQGNWVLVDFWASWCGPCKAEMPTVVDAYNKYHSKGFEVVGLSFDREKEPWLKAIVEWEMPWIHLSDLKYWKTVAAEVYSVDAIPDNLLIDPEGTVVARGLRGRKLQEKLAGIFE